MTNWQSRRILDSQAHQNLSYSLGVNGRNILDRYEKVVTLETGAAVTEFMSCSYLGLECDSRLANAAQDAVKVFGVQFAAARTRLKPVIFHNLELLLQKIFDGPTVTFSTVGQCHLALIPLLGSGSLPSFPILDKGPYWIVDKTSHASIQILRGIMEQFGEVERVDFQDGEALASSFLRAHRHGRTPIAVGDGVGSMGGNAPVQALFAHAEEFQGFVYLDDAHGTSIFGQHGGGYVLDALGTSFHPRLALASSLSKAFGATGGALTVPTQADADAIVRYATPYIFGGPVSLPGIAAALASAEIHLSPELATLQSRLRANLELFDSLAGEPSVNSSTGIPIRGLRVGNEERALHIARELLHNGFAVTTAMYPTVAKGRSMLRVALSALHTEAQITGLLDCFHWALQNSSHSLELGEAS